MRISGAIRLSGSIRHAASFTVEFGEHPLPDFFSRIRFRDAH